MPGQLFLIPNSLGNADPDTFLPPQMKSLIGGLRYFVVEKTRNARRYLKTIDPGIVIDDLTFFELNKHTDPGEISSFLRPVLEGHDLGVISEAGLPGIADPGAGDFSVDVPLTVLRPQPDSDPFVVTWRTTQGQAVTQGGQLSADLRITNISEKAQRAILILRSPRGIGIDESEPQWRCRTEARAGSSRTVCRGPMLESGESADLPASIEARSSHPTGFVELTARGRGSSTDAALALNVVDPGDPVASAGVWVKPKLRWQPWNDGSIRSIPVGQADQWRIVVSNIGGDDLLAGRSATIRQRFAPGVEVVPRTNSASKCEFTEAVLTCTIAARRDVSPQERIGAVTLDITPTLAESSIVEGALTARITTARRGRSASGSSSATGASTLITRSM